MEEWGLQAFSSFQKQENPEVFWPVSGMPNLTAVMYLDWEY